MYMCCNIYSFVNEINWKHLLCIMGQIGYYTRKSLVHYGGTAEEIAEHSGLILEMMEGYAWANATRSVGMYNILCVGVCIYINSIIILNV